MSDTSQRGLMSHTAILNRLVQLGFEVLLPWADHLGYDLAYYVTEEHRSLGFFVHQRKRILCECSAKQRGLYLRTGTVLSLIQCLFQREAR